MFEVFVFQFNGVDIEVNEQFNVVIGFDRECMVGFKDFVDGIVNRGDYFVIGWFDSDVIINDFFSKNYIWYVFDVDDFVREWGNNFNSFGVFFIIRNQRFQFIE